MQNVLISSESEEIYNWKFVGKYIFFSLPDIFVSSKLTYVNWKVNAIACILSYTLVIFI